VMGYCVVVVVGELTWQKNELTKASEAKQQGW